jgi:hypothetical protein
MSRTYPLKEYQSTCPGIRCCNKKLIRRPKKRALKAETEFLVMDWVFWQKDGKVGNNIVKNFSRY